VKLKAGMLMGSWLSVATSVPHLNTPGLYNWITETRG